MLHMYIYVYINKIVNDYIRSLYCVLLMRQWIWVVTAKEWSQLGRYSDETVPW